MAWNTLFGDSDRWHGDPELAQELADLVPGTTDDLPLACSRPVSTTMASSRSPTPRSSSPPNRIDRVPPTRPGRVAVLVGTVGERRLGVLAAHDGPTRARRLDTLYVAAALDPLPIDEGVAHAWATLRLALRDAGKRMPINDSWIAATAIANDMAVASQDGDYDDIPGLRVIRI